MKIMQGKKEMRITMCSSLQLLCLISEKLYIGANKEVWKMMLALAKTFDSMEFHFASFCSNWNLLQTKYMYSDGFQLVHWAFKNGLLLFAIILKEKKEMFTKQQFCYWPEPIPKYHEFNEPQ